MSELVSEISYQVSYRSFDSCQAHLKLQSKNVQQRRPLNANDQAQQVSPHVEGYCTKKIATLSYEEHWRGASHWIH